MGLVKLNGPTGKTLRRATQPVTDIETQVIPYVDEAMHILSREKGVGLAANQMGVNYAWYLDTQGIVHINPRITSKDEEVEIVEGCLSLPERWYRMTRFEKITVEFEDLSGEERTAELEGLHALVAQHECDHLDGLLICDVGERFYAGDKAEVTA